MKHIISKTKVAIFADKSLLATEKQPESTVNHNRVQKLKWDTFCILNVNVKLGGVNFCVLNRSQGINSSQCKQYSDITYRPGGEGGEGHPEGKFVRPTFFSQFGGADFENACYTGVQGGRLPAIWD